MKKILIPVLWGVFISACGEHDAVKNVATVFKKTDSLELIFYPDPHNQKHYQLRRSSDSTLISLLLRDLEGDSISANTCLHYKKLYLFAGGDVYKTVYISDSCEYLAYSTNGTQQFRRLTNETKNALRRITPSAPAK